MIMITTQVCVQCALLNRLFYAASTGAPMWAGELVAALVLPSTSKFRPLRGSGKLLRLGRTKFPTIVEFSLEAEVSRSRKDIPLGRFRCG
jgi:hypothetical protein